MDFDAATIWAAFLWLGGLLGVGAVIAAYFSETLRQLLPNPRRVARSLKRAGRDKGPHTHFKVLIADLKRDADGSQTDHVAAALAPIRSIEVVRIGSGPEWDFGSRSHLEYQARRLLETQDGDVLIFGELAKAEERLRLQIIGRQADAAKYASYPLESTNLPANFSFDFNAVLVTAVVTSATEAAFLDLGVMKLHAERLARLCANMPPGLDGDQRGSLWHTLGLAAGVLGDRLGQSDWLERSISAFRAALEERTRERAPLDWATTQMNLGDALWTLDKREIDAAKMEVVATILASGMDKRTGKMTAPLDGEARADTALAPIHDRTRRSREQALAAIDAALEVFRTAGATTDIARAERTREWIAGE